MKAESALRAMADNFRRGQADDASDRQAREDFRRLWTDPEIGPGLQATAAALLVEVEANPAFDGEHDLRPSTLPPEAL